MLRYKKYIFKSLTKTVAKTLVKLTSATTFAVSEETVPVKIKHKFKLLYCNL